VPIPVVCACGAKLKVSEEQAGKKLRCPACKALIGDDDIETRRRHGNLPKEWSDLGDAGTWTGRWRLSNLQLVRMQKVSEDVLCAGVELELRAGWGIRIPFIAAFRYTKTTRVTLRKLFIRKDGRGFLVNGRPEDKTDLRFLEALKRRAV
jgi:hypothetical protein